jgi:hypothetical protein
MTDRLPENRRLRSHGVRGITVGIDKETRVWMEAYCAAHGVSRASIIRAALLRFREQVDHAPPDRTAPKDTAR